MPAKKIAVFHSDLGIGGAERLVSDIVLQLDKLDVKSSVFTNYYEERRSFDDLKAYFKENPGKLFVVGKALPLTFFGFLQVLMSIFKMYLLLVYFLIFHRKDYDVVLTDQVGYCVLPILKLFKFKTVFYFHFPDFLLTRRKSLLRSIYRFPFDSFEKFCYGYADLILFNSGFTKEVALSCIGSISNKKHDILYPTFTKPNLKKDKQTTDEVFFSEISTTYQNIFISLNRFEFKKNVELAVRAFHHFKSRCVADNRENLFSNSCLIVAGGYDERSSENKENFLKLKQVVEGFSDSEFNNKVVFFKTPTENLKYKMFEKSSLLLYTPKNEHFGIIPLEAMSLGCPVAADESGGPIETVKNKKTGFLIKDYDEESWGDVLYDFATLKDSEKEGIKKAAVAHVNDHFSQEIFRDRLKKLVLNTFFK